MGKELKKNMIQRECIFCKKETHTFINAPDNDSYEENNYDVYFCIECDVAFIPFCDLPENLNENYETKGYYSEFNEKINNSQKPSEILLYLEKIFYNKRLNVLKQFKNNGKLLDVGCGSGKFLMTASTTFNKLHGVEISNQGQKYLTEKNIESEKFLLNSNFNQSNFLTYFL